MMRRTLISATTLLLCVSAPSAMASPGTVLRDETIYSQPSSGAAVAGSAAKGASVDILAKQGGWLRVTAGKTTGWIRLLSVRAGAGGAGGTGVSDVVGAATTRSDPSRVVAVAGLRGLNDEELKQAKFNGAELTQLDTWVVTVAQAKTFAGQAGLVAVNVPALPEPKPARAPSSWESN
jgi:Bacterial SH3 domain